MIQMGSNRGSRLTTSDKKRMANSFNKIVEFLKTKTQKELNTIKTNLEFEMDGKTILINSSSRQLALDVALQSKKE